jgi:hypothetical protein
MRIRYTHRPNLQARHEHEIPAVELFSDGEVRLHMSSPNGISQAEHDGTELIFRLRTHQWHPEEGGTVVNGVKMRKFVQRHKQLIIDAIDEFFGTEVDMHSNWSYVTELHNKFEWDFGHDQ